MKLIALLLSLSLLVITHELGHLLLAKLFRTRVRRFYLFFNWGFSILKAKKFDGKWHFLFFNSDTPDDWYEASPDKPREQWDLKEPDRTLWGIGWLPLGGYCDIAGMIDETKGADSLAREPQPWEYRSKKPWQRLLIISGGVLVNFASALLIYAAIFAHWGKDELPLRSATLGYDYHQMLLDSGLRSGDVVWSVDGQEVASVADLTERLMMDNPRSLTVRRTYLLDSATGRDSAALVRIDLGPDFRTRLLQEQPQQLLALRMPMVVADFVAGSPAQRAGMRPGDSVVSVAGIHAVSYDEITEQLQRHKGETARIGFYRRDGQGAPRLGEAAVELGPDGKMGIFLRQPTEVFAVAHTNYTLLQAFPEGVRHGWETLATYVGSLKMLFVKGGVQNLGGFGTLGSLFPSTWDWQRFWNITAFLAIILAFMNIIPIPGLDGGHILFTLWEMVTRRKPKDKFLEVAQSVGMILLLLLLVVANGNDLLRWFRNMF